MANEDMALEIASLEGWSADQKVLHKTFSFASFSEALQFVNRVAAIAEAQDHHPDIDIRYNKVSLHLSSHDVGAITKRDTRLARSISAIEA
ncbi:MAG: 4a-hydroxytetrahydrobiopterin dehydratase [Acidobacteriaceae bacterium]